MGKTHFSTELFDFLGELKAHNDRDWFQRNKVRFDRNVRDAMLTFIADLAPRLHKLSRHFVVDPKPTGGSLFRIYRDVRFSADKSPFKTYIAAHFPHERCEGSAPGFYISLSPGESISGGGIWHPEADALKRIRDAIVAAAPEWKKAVRGLSVGGESLKRPPKGYDPGHPLIDDLRRKDFTSGHKYQDREVCGPDFLDRFVDDCRATAPLVRFLSGALGLPF
jgi:uncharacterized protein (TIGR02453 family)